MHFSRRHTLSLWLMEILLYQFQSLRANTLPAELVNIQPRSLLQQDPRSIHAQPQMGQELTPAEWPLTANDLLDTISSLSSL